MVNHNVNTRSFNYNTNSVISQPTSPDSTVYSFSDDLSSTICSDESSHEYSTPETIPEKIYLKREGHLLLLLPPDNEAYGQKSGINTWMIGGLACGICRNSLGIDSVYKCDGCSMMIHEECLNDVIYPCVPTCFDEPKILESFLRVFASLLSNYRDFLVLDNQQHMDSIIEDEFDSSTTTTSTTTTTTTTTTNTTTTTEDADELFKKNSFLKTVNKDAKVIYFYKNYRMFLSFFFIKRLLIIYHFHF
jgi:hypothetical protein